ncbi:hypothetical protein K491DRAFT_591648 [Lophiostoma macrostomum CBS 122681]|uniref:Signal peptide-containing protein n=1 Tax=Lophiostoma macrostomum CBS 122681 TaxID=1314788 RepID=A0A6A6TGQ1_9PLEO|nr:hypothetical protein K491DRAFT_591648 [Lophiostoma macrostomum CBS 122681]
MSWFLRGVQSAVFHYASCAPCTGYMHRKKRRKQAKRDRQTHHRLKAEQPELYHHPEPTGTNPFWDEEIVMGPGPPPRRAKRTNTGTASQKGFTAAGNTSAVGSHAGSNVDINRGDDALRLSDDTTDDENWNRKRYQREDEELWGLEEPSSPSSSKFGRDSSTGVGGVNRPSTSKSSAESYFTARAPPVNDLHPPIVSMPSPNASDNHWMLQPPPKASIMSGKERATTRSRSGSGASSRIELSLQRQVSVRQLKVKLDRGETPEMPPLSRGSSYNNMFTLQRHDRPRTPNVRPPSAASSRKKKKRRDPVGNAPSDTNRSSGESSDTIVHSKSSVKFAGISSLRVVRVRGSRQRLSTVISSGSGISPPEPAVLGLGAENQLTRRSRYTSDQSSDSAPYLMKHRSPLMNSDASSLNVLQDLVSPRALLSSRFVSAPLVEAKIRLPAADMEEETTLNSIAGKDWVNTDHSEATVPFDSVPGPERDPRMRWSVDF